MPTDCRKERAAERAELREWIYGALIDLTWRGVPNAGDPGVEPKPMGAAAHIEAIENR